MINFTTVIICTYNRAQQLKRALESLVNQTLKQELFEVIVVDDGSTDNTVEVCKEMCEKLPNIHYVSAGQNIGLGCAANLGIQSAKGHHILFTDDDCIVNEDWIERLSEALVKNPIVAGAIASPVSDFLTLCHNIAEFGPFMPGRRRGSIQFIAGANMGFRHSVLDELNGFSERKNEFPDMEIILRAREKGYEIFFEPAAIITHDPDRGSLRSILKYSADHASRTIVFRNQYRSLLLTPFILQSPILILLSSPVIAFGLASKYYLNCRGLFKRFWTFPVVYLLKLAWCWGAFCGLRNWRSREPSGS